MCRVRAISSLQSFGWCWLVTSVLLVACSLAPWPAPRLPSFSLLFRPRRRPGRRLERAVVPPGLPTVCFWVRAGAHCAPGPYPVFEAPPAAQRSTHGHGDGLEAWWTHADTRHPLGRHRSWVPAPVRGPPRVVEEGRHAGAGEPVTVYGGPGGENPLLISSAQRGRAFLGTMQSRSTVQPGPVTPLDEKVSVPLSSSGPRGPRQRHFPPPV
jgi:hypothetical protein